jgi:hypothetical protein
MTCKGGTRDAKSLASSPAPSSGRKVRVTTRNRIKSSRRANNKREARVGRGFGGLGRVALGGADHSSSEYLQFTPISRISRRQHPLKGERLTPLPPPLLHRIPPRRTGRPESGHPPPPAPPPPRPPRGRPSCRPACPSSVGAASGEAEGQLLAKPLIGLEDGAGSVLTSLYFAR